ncbi:MAG TPA: hypothetical protein DCP92_23400 [Nitrospiraceae bacterium]|jgi:hypothetical protein|nr:hypothetical protein [Nitrospiraceae bacterium]
MSVRYYDNNEIKQNLPSPFNRIDWQRQGIELLVLEVVMPGSMAERLMRNRKSDEALSILNASQKAVN